MRKKFAWTWILALNLAFTAGCLGGDPSLAPASSDVEAEPPADAWGAADQLSVMKGTATTRKVEDGWCFNVTAGPFRLRDSMDHGNSLHRRNRCALVVLDSNRIPLGTKTLRVSADTTQATVVGTFEATLLTYGSNLYRGAATSEEKATWDFELSPVDWDPPAREKSGAEVNFGPGGEISILQGTVAYELLAIRDPSWHPKPMVDHWNRTDLHDFINESVIHVWGENVRTESPAFAEMGLGIPWPPAFRPKDVIPNGTQEIALIVRWSSSLRCPTLAEACAPNPRMISGGSHLHSSQPGRAGPGWGYQIYEAPEDHDYANSSAVLAYVWLRTCYPVSYDDLPIDPPFIVPFVGCQNTDWLEHQSADIRFDLEGWRTPVDPASLEARYGLS